MKSSAKKGGPAGPDTRIQAVLFDMDGVLIDAKDWHYDALNQALALFGMEISRDEHLAIYDGLPTRKKLEMLTKSRGFPPALHNFVNELKQAKTLQMTFERCRPMFHHQFALSNLHRAGYKLAVCSNSIRQTVLAMMEKAALDSYLDIFMSNEDVSKPKPDPEMYTKAMEKLGFEPKQCLIVEDNDHGIAAARASGGHVMVVGTVYDVTYERLMKSIAEAESAA